MAERDRAAIGIHPLIVIGNTELAQCGKALAGEGLVQFDHVELFLIQAEPCQKLGRGRRRADAHDARRHAGGGTAENAGNRSQTVFSRRFR